MLDDLLQSKEDKQPVQSHPDSDSQTSPSPLLTSLSLLPTLPYQQLRRHGMDEGEFLF